MSSSYPKHPGYLAALLFLALAGPAQAAQVYSQLQADVGVEVDSNRNMVASGESTDIKATSEGNTVDVSDTLGIATPRSDTTIRPEIRYAEYPTLDTDDLRTILDVNSQFRSQRDQASFEGRYDRESTYGSELASAEFNPVNPYLPTTPETGRINVSTIRTLATAVPSYTLDLTQRLNWGVNAIAQSVDYSGTSAQFYVPYEYVLGGTSLGWAVTPLLSATVGVFTSRELAKNDSASVDANGVSLGFGYKWSPQFTMRLELTGERDDSVVVTPAPSKFISTGTGATYTTEWQGQLSKLQLSAGRTFTPSGAGGTFRDDQLQLQYSRDLTQRLAFTAAGHFISAVSVAGIYSNQNYNYVNATAELKWMITRTWHVGGGLEYIRDHFVPPVGSAANGVIYAFVGYQGLGRPY
jgi:roadblock/LC7 domain-containing protein